MSVGWDGRPSAVGTPASKAVRVFLERAVRQADSSSQRARDPGAATRRKHAREADGRHAARGCGVDLHAREQPEVRVCRRRPSRHAEGIRRTASGAACLGRDYARCSTQGAGMNSFSKSRTA